MAEAGSFAVEFESIDKTSKNVFSKSIAGFLSEQSEKSFNAQKNTKND